MKKKNVLILSIGVIVILAIAGVFGWQRMTASTAKTTTAMQTSTVKRGSLIATVSASGNISAPNAVSAAFASSGRVAKVNVKIGDTVKKDQVLMELNTTDLELTYKSAQKSLASAQVNYDQTKSDLQFALTTAQANRDSAKASLEAAKAENAQNPNSLVIAKAALENAKITLQSAQTAYDAVAWRPDVGMTTQASTLQSATIAYQSALATFNKTAATINDSALVQAQTAYTNAQTSLEQANKNLDTKLATAQLTLDSAQVSLDQAQRNLDNAKLVAPFDGTVSAVNYAVGDTASGTAVAIVDLSQLQVKVTVSEVDIAKIKVGETAVMTLDALSGKTYNAKVTAVAPVGTVTSGVVNYSVTLEITNSDGAIKPGMTATLSIEAERRDNVLLVPLKAVKTVGNQKIVTIQSGGQAIAKPVSTGLSNETSVEITNGLNEGDMVVLNQTTTTTSTGNMGGMGIMGIGGGPSGPPPGQ
ncbi:MAG: efflux RND transporter periplasmic adaptor subunit [Chloroflexi bacterium]|nr:efflux RND transporter periplasmic adaptor subunit [Chloroflexota bacterium]